MRLTWYGHSCFKLDSERGSVIFDPFYDDYVPGIKNLPNNITVDEVLCSHSHKDHSAAKLINLSQKQHSYGIERIESYHDDKNGALRGNNFITIIKCDNKKIVHFGDLGCELTDAILEELKNADIAMIPIGGYYTINAEQAYKIVKEINAKITIPMHYRGDGFGFDVIDTKDRFLQLSENNVFLSSNVLDLNENGFVLPATIVFKLP